MINLKLCAGAWQSKVLYTKKYLTLFTFSFLAYLEIDFSYDEEHWPLMGALVPWMIHSVF